MSDETRALIRGFLIRYDQESDAFYSSSTINGEDGDQDLLLFRQIQEERRRNTMRKIATLRNVFPAPDEIPFEEPVRDAVDPDRPLRVNGKDVMRRYIPKFRRQKEAIERDLARVEKQIELLVRPGKTYGPAQLDTLIRRSQHLKDQLAGVLVGEQARIRDYDRFLATEEAIVKDPYVRATVITATPVSERRKRSASSKRNRTPEEEDETLGYKAKVFLSTLEMAIQPAGTIPREVEESGKALKMRRKNAFKTRVDEIYRAAGAAMKPEPAKVTPEDTGAARGTEFGRNTLYNFF